MSNIDQSMVGKPLYIYINFAYLYIKPLILIIISVCVKITLFLVVYLAQREQFHKGKGEEIICLPQH